MNADNRTMRTRLNDYFLLMEGFAAFAVGLGMSSSAPLWVSLTYAAVLELLLLSWAYRRCGGSDALRFTARMQATLAIRTVVAVYGTAACCVLALYVINSMPPGAGPETMRWIAPAMLKSLAIWGLAFCPLVVLFISLWVLHDYSKRDIPMRELASGAYLHTTLPLTSSEEKTRLRLEHFLRRAASDSARPIDWLMYGRRTSLALGSDAAGHASYTCTWMGCPSKLVFTVKGNASASVVDVRCVLRSGYYQHELSVFPGEGLTIMDYAAHHVLDALRSEMALSEARERQETLRLHALEMQLRVLQAQVEPHFLFNTMANLRQLYRTDIEAGEDMLNHLISYLRGAMEDLRSDQSTVAREIDLVRHFLAIMKVRMGERLSYTFVLFDDAGTQAFPPAMLISLVENAIKHGLRDVPNGQLRISATREDGKIRISVADNGPGFGSVEGTGVGLSNIRQRLEAMYGQDAWLEVGAQADGGFVSTIVVPST